MITVRVLTRAKSGRSRLHVARKAAGYIQNSLQFYNYMYYSLRWGSFSAAIPGGGDVTHGSVVDTAAITGIPGK